MTEPAEIVLARVTMKLEQITDALAQMQTNIEADRKESKQTERTLIDLRGRLHGALSLLAVFQVAFFGLMAWLFSNVSGNNLSITELRGEVQRVETQTSANKEQINIISTQLRQRFQPTQGSQP